MRKLELHWQILIALILSVLFGLYLSEYVSWVTWMGDLFMRALKMIIVPLVLTSIISGVSNIGNAENLGRLGLKTLTFYISTSLLAILTGLFFVNLIKPGIGVDIGLAENVDDIKSSAGSFKDILMNIVPENIFQAFASGEMLSIIFFSMLFGFFITRLPNENRMMLTNFFNSLFEVMMKLTMFIIKFTPIGIFGIVATVIAENVNNLVELASGLGKYFITVLLGLGTHYLITLPLIVKFVGKSKPYKLMRVMRSALLTAFSTASSGATLSLTMDRVNNGAGVSKGITSFTLPLGATINMDGTALYECVAAMFIAQAYGYDLSFMQQVVVVFTALLASVGAASIPMAGLIMITIILSAVGLPLEGLGLILAVDRLLDMLRTSTNVWSDSCGAVTVAKSEGETLNV